MVLHIFDFDGTLYKKDSMLDFIRLVHSSKLKYYLINFMFIPTFLLRLLNLISFETYKSRFIKMHFKGVNRNLLNDFSKVFKSRFSDSLFPGVKDFIDNAVGDKCIVSASLDIWMEGVSDSLGVDLICTKSVFINDSFIKISKNCNYKEKKIRVKEKYTLEKYSKIYIYGNSKGDFDLYTLGIKRHNYFKHYSNK